LKGWQLWSELAGATWSEARAWKKMKREKARLKKPPNTYNTTLLEMTLGL